MEASTVKDLLRQAYRDIEQYRNDNRKINEITEALVTKITGAEYSSVWLNDFPLLVREREEGNNAISLEEKKGLLYQSFLTQKPAIYNYLTSEKGYVPEIDNPDSIRIKSKIVIPLQYKNELLGIVTCYSSVKKIKNFSKEDLERFKAITPFVIDAMLRMHANRGKSFAPTHIPREHIGESKPRYQEIVKKLEKIETKSAQTADPKEILDRTSAIVHDIRTPANSLLGFLEILEEQIQEKRLQEYVHHAVKSAKLINDLTTSILDGLAEERLREISRPERIVPYKFFAELGKVFSANMYNKGVEYNIFIDPKLPREATLEALKLKRVLMNLLGNAAKFTPQGGTVEYSVVYDAEKREAQISVKDTGIGIPPEVQEKIFQPYTQADESTKEIYGGSGLGLSISAKFVRDLGGELHLESQVEEGSTFSFSLPLKEADTHPWLEEIEDAQNTIAILYDAQRLVPARNIIRYLSSFGIDSYKIKPIKSLKSLDKEVTHLILFEGLLDEEALKEVKQQGVSTLIVEEGFLSLDPEKFPGSVVISKYEEYGEKLYSFVAPKRAPKVLIVEDDRISVELIKAMLQEEYCEVDVTYDGQEGLQMLESALVKNHPYDILFCDHNMPGLSGEEMIRRYREMEEAKDVAKKLLAVSISGDPLSGGKQEDLFDEYVGKPFKKEELVSILQKIQNQNKEK
jgi:signal transduction histidine kinase